MTISSIAYSSSESSLAPDSEIAMSYLMCEYIQNRPREVRVGEGLLHRVVRGHQYNQVTRGR